MSNFYDFEVINREIPIEDVLAYHGILPSQKARGEGWYSIRQDDDTPSAHIDAKRRFGNTIHDFGYGNTFNPLTLTMYLQGVDMVEASRILGEAFNVAPKIVGHEGENPANIVSDYDWRSLGIHPDMVSKNVEFDLEKYSISSTMWLSEQLRISMSELRNRVTGPEAEKADDRDKRRYEGILRTKAVPLIHDKRDEYFRRMNDDYQLAIAVNPNMDVEKIFEIHRSDYEAMAKNLSTLEFTLKKVLDGTSIRFKGRRYNPREDFRDVIKGEISFEIGANSHFEVSRDAYRGKAKVFYCVVSLEEYEKLMRNGMDAIKVAARQKGEQVSLSFLSTDSSKVNYLVKALRGKETVLAESFGAALEAEMAAMKPNAEKTADVVSQQSTLHSVEVRSSGELGAEIGVQQRSDSQGPERVPF